MNTLNPIEPFIVAPRLAPAPGPMHPEPSPASQTETPAAPALPLRSLTLAIKNQNSKCNNPPPASSPPHRSQPSYALRKGLGAWELTFDGRRAVLRHEQGLYYVAYLLTHPHQEPLHALALTLNVKALYEQPAGAGAAENLIQERNLGLDDAQAARALRRKQLELEALVDDDEQTEPVKAEALRELEAIYQFQRTNPWRSRSTAQKSVRAVTMAIKRLHQRLAKAVDTEGNPHPVFRPFARHLREHLLVPSGRACGHGGFRARDILAGCFTYEPPPGVVWSSSSGLLLK